MIDHNSIRTDIPAVARRYDVWLGGKDNFAADRVSAAAIGRVFPPIIRAVEQNRRCLLRAVRFLTAECGIRQFLDIGCGVPTSHDNVHHIAQQITPDSRIVYVDHDELVGVHARALHVSTPQGAVAFHLGDLRQPREIISADLVRGTLDFSRPVAVLLFAVLHFLADDDDARTALDELMAGLPAGSYLALSHATYDPLAGDLRDQMDAFTQPDSADGPFTPRTHDQITALLTGLDLVEPGLVSTVHWRPDLHPPADQSLGEAEAIAYAAVAVKP